MPTITILVNNTAEDNLRSEHGLSLWIEYKGKKILFDTGQTSAVTGNAEKIGVDLTSTDTVILSHGHYDHTGGIPAVFEIAKKASLYLHPNAIDERYSKKPGKIKNVGMSEASREIIKSKAEEGRTVSTRTPTEVFPGFFVTGKIPRNNSFEDTGGNFYLDKDCSIPDELPDDQAAFYKTDKGLTVILGCAHSGVVSTLDYIKKLTFSQNIYTVIGGMHLLNASEDRINKTIKSLKENKVENISPAHCTGNSAKIKIKNAFGSKCFECYDGMKI